MDRVFVGATLNDCSWSLDVLAQSEYRMSSHCRVSYALLDTAFCFVGVVFRPQRTIPSTEGRSLPRSLSLQGFRRHRRGGVKPRPSGSLPDLGDPCGLGA